MSAPFCKNTISRKPEDRRRDLSKRLFETLPQEHLDPAKLYFLKSDIEEFKKDESDLDDQLHDGDLDFAYKVYERFTQRVEERQKLIDELVNGKHDFTAKESLDTDYDKLDYASNQDEVRERWRKRIKFDLLMQKVAEKPLPDDEAKKKVLESLSGACSSAGSRSTATTCWSCT